MLTEPDGFLLRYVVYDGANNDTGGPRHTQKVVVLFLLEGWLQKGYTLFMDNFYNSFALSKKLLEGRPSAKMKN